MEIELKRNYGYELLFKAENVTITEDIEEREYFKKEDGKLDFSKNPKRDIKTDILEQFSTLLSDMIHYREKSFNSSDLIEQLFDKLPKENKEIVFKTIKNHYE